MVGELVKMHRACLAGETVQPSLLHGEASMGASQAVSAPNTLIEHGEGRAPRQAVIRIAIKRVLAHVEIEGRKIVDAEIEQSVEHALEVEAW